MAEEERTGPSVIYLDVDDDIAAVRERLSRVEGWRVLIVVPRGCRALTSLLDLKLLARRARDLALEIALVTSNPTTRRLAREVGIPVFFSLKRGQKVKWRWKGGAVQELPRREAPGSTAPRPMARPALGGRPRWWERALAVLLLLAVISALLAGAALAVPGATVVLVPASQEVSTALQVVADPEVKELDHQRGQIPARVVKLQIEGRGQMPVTGTKDAPDERARGTVVFINMINQPVTIPEGTVVSTSAGTIVRFTTVEEVTLPGVVGGTVKAEVVAVDPGLSGNVGANLINRVEGPLSLHVRVTNPEPTEGGSIKQVGVVTAADKERLKASLLQKLQQEAHALIEERLQEGEFVPPESVVVDEVISETYDRFTGEEAEVLNLDLRIRVSGTAINERDAKLLALRALEAEVGEGFKLVPQSVHVQVGEITTVEGRKVSFSMRVFGLAVTKVDVDRVRAEVRGQPPEVAKERLRQHLLLEEEPVVRIWPEWWRRAPWLPFRIDVVIQEREVLP